MTACQSLDGLEVMFDDERAVANAGLLLPATLADRLGLERRADEVIRLGGPGSFRPGRKAMTLVHAMVAGGDCIDDIDVLRAGETERVVGHRVMAPSTCGTFLRSFTFGHVRLARRLVRVRAHRGVGGGRRPWGCAGDDRHRLHDL